MVRRRLADLDEDEVLREIVPLLRAFPAGAAELLGPGDDAAVIAAPSRSVVVTTDGMVRDRDWRDEWSTATDVGHKVVVSNLADIAAMGARPSGLLVAVSVDPATPLAWLRNLAIGIGEAAHQYGVPVVGGDLSSAGPGVVVVSVTALGDLEGRAPVLRSGARPGDGLWVAGPLGRSGAGLALLQAGRAEAHPEAVARHRRPDLPMAAALAAPAAGVSAMIDVSDGLLRDAARLASSSGVRLDLDRAALRGDVTALCPALGEDQAWECVLSGGEEHSLLGTFPPSAQPEHPWRRIGRVGPGPAGVAIDGQPVGARGWDHFRR
jgi:thiamine-monophosphate kinase